MFREKASKFIVKASNIFESILGIILISAIIINIVPIISTIFGDYISLGKTTEFSVILENIFSVIIGVEFLKMLCRHDIDSVVEVVMFTLARKLIVEHGTSVDNLLTILSIAILFGIRKYLFIKQLDRHE